MYVHIHAVTFVKLKYMVFCDIADNTLRLGVQFNNNEDNSAHCYKKAKTT